jgi:hypothetical protein
MSEGYEGFAILELMGHRRLAGRLVEATIAGASFVRIDIPGPDGEIVATQFHAPHAIYAITPTTDAIARSVAARNQPTPAHRWELPALPAQQSEDVGDDAELWDEGPGRSL